MIIGAVKFNFWIGLLAATALIFGAAYSLWMVKRVVFGAVVHQHVKDLVDLSSREFFMLAILEIAVLAMGLYPEPFTAAMQTSVTDLLTHVAKTKINAF